LPQRAGIKKTLKVDEALFSAKSFEELGLPHLLVEQGLTAPTEVQATAIPTRVKNRFWFKNRSALVLPKTGKTKNIDRKQPKFKF
jgi:superfamily II DNA/RNA helicase